MWAVVIFILSVLIANGICKVINQNTIGTTGAYLKRAFIVWVITLFVLLWIWGKITGTV